MVTFSSSKLDPLLTPVSPSAPHPPISGFSGVNGVGSLASWVAPMTMFFLFAFRRPRRRMRSQALKKLIVTSEEGSLQTMQRGVDRLADIVSSTLGPKGRNVIIGQGFGPPKVVNDGVTVAKAVEFEDEIQQLGAQLIREAASKTNDVAGDGTTTATVLSRALVHEGVKLVTAGVSPMQLSLGMEKAGQHLIVEVLKRSTPVKTNADLLNVASVSAGGDRDIGKLIADAMEKVGKDGVITLEESKTAETQLTIEEGMSIDRGYVSPFFCTDVEKMQVVFEDAMVLLVDDKLSNVRDLMPILEECVKAARPLLIVAEDFETEVLNLLIYNRVKGALRVVAVRTPGFGDRRQQALADLAVLTGAKVVQPQAGLPLTSAVDQQVFGVSPRVEVMKDSSVVVGQKAAKPAVEARVNLLKTQLKAASSNFEKDKLTERIAKLSGGVGILSIGAHTEAELAGRKLRVEDALAATKAALIEGISVGGGYTLASLWDTIDGKFLKTLNNDEQRQGAQIVQRSLTAPLRQIATNAGFDGSVVVNECFKQKKGFNAETGQYEDLLKAGVLDPTRVLRSVLENSISVAKTFLTSTVAIAIQKQDPPGGAMGGMPPGMF